MNLPKRKPTRLKDYDYSLPGAYFVTICTHNRQSLFGEIVGETLCGLPGKMIEKWLIEIQNKFVGVKIDNYVIMPNHIHFILSKTGDHTGSPLQDMVGWFKTMTTNEYIKMVKENKCSPFCEKLWQRSYHDHIICGEEDYKKIWEYIDTNVIKWEQDCFYN